MKKRPIILVSILAMTLMLSSCGSTSVVEGTQDSTKLSLNAFEANRSDDLDVMCNGLSANYSEVGVGWYSTLSRGAGDHLPSRKGVGDHLPFAQSSAALINRGAGDHLPSRRGVGDHLPSRSYSESLMFVEESGDVQSKEAMVCANFVASMQVAVASDADSLLVSVAGETVSVSVINGFAQIDIALEDLQETEVLVQDVNSGEVMSILFAGI